jgi:protein tyrosine/serine phosphatase
MLTLNNIGLVPLSNFGIVRADLYRSAQPLYYYQYSWMAMVLGIQQIISLRSESRHDQIMTAESDINVVNIDVHDHMHPTEYQVDQFIMALNKKVPTLFHCAHGHGRTSTFSVISKVYDGMTFEQALADEHDRFHYQFRHRAQIDFLKRYYGST